MTREFDALFLLELEMVEAVALFDYHGRTNQELSFRTNQIISISEKLNHQWWFGYLAGQNQSGLIPDGYFKLKSRFKFQYHIISFHINSFFSATEIPFLFHLV
jgi:hypothetical protein